MSNQCFGHDSQSNNNWNESNNHSRERSQSTSRRSEGRSISPKSEWRELENNLTYSKQFSHDYSRETSRIGEKRKIEDFASQNKRFESSTFVPFTNDTDSSVNCGFNDNTFSSYEYKVPNEKIYSNDQYIRSVVNNQEEHSRNEVTYDSNKEEKIQYDLDIQIKQECEDYVEYNNEGQENQLEQNAIDQIPNKFTMEEQQSSLSVASSSHDTTLTTLSNQKQSEHQESQVEQTVNTENQKAHSIRNFDLLVDRSKKFARLIGNPLSLHGRFRVRKYTKKNESSNIILIERNCYRSPIKKNTAIRLPYTALTMQSQNLRNQMYFKRIRRLRTIMQLPKKKKQPIIPITIIPKTVINNPDKEKTSNLDKTSSFTNMPPLCIRCKREVELKVDVSCQTDAISSVQLANSCDPRTIGSNSAATEKTDIRPKKNVLNLEEYRNRRAIQEPKSSFKMTSRGACSSGLSSNRF